MGGISGKKRGKIMITIRLKDGKELHFENEVTLFEAAKKISNSLAKDVLVAKVDGELTDIRNNITDGTQVEFFTKADKEGLFTLRHTAAHVMAQAIQHLYPGTKFAIGPAIDDGFYYDLESDHVFSQEDFAAIEKEMAKIAKANLPIEKKILSRNEALEFFRSRNQDYKVILIQDLPEDAIISTYTQGDFTDLCRGPHVRSTGKLKVFKLMTVAGAYWRGDEHNKMLQRIYATAFFDKEELDRFLFVRAEAEKRDHRKLGKQLNLFSFHEEGPGFPFFHPKGMVIRNELIAYERELFREFGYEEIMTPIILSKKLWLQSGHWDHYKENMFPQMEMDGESFVLRPMNCPHHMMIYANKLHSYKNLPIRIGEIAHDFRYEASGAVKGIERGRHFCQNDAHLFVTPEQIKSEFKGVIDLILDVYKDFNITDYRCVLSLRDPEDKEKYHDDDEMWNKAENELREVMNELGIEYTEEIGEAAFYGPKLDVNVKPAIGNEITLSTCQLDFCLPAKFNLTYVAEDGTKKTPVVLHRAILGSLDRFMAYILEETKGNLPLWLAPTQVKVLPVKNEYHLDYAQEIYQLLLDEGFEVELDSRDEKLGYRIREAQMQKANYILVLGNNERDERTVTYRKHGEQKATTVTIDEFVSMLKQQIKDKK